jgi:hypothetical protein
MPLIEVTYDGSVDEEVLRRLGELLSAVWLILCEGAWSRN